MGAFDRYFTVLADNFLGYETKAAETKRTYFTAAGSSLAVLFTISYWEIENNIFLFCLLHCLI